MKALRKRIVLVAWSLLGIFIFQIVSPTAAYGLTGGPSSPEVQSFTPVGVSDMVDMFSGDFKYNIPLMEVDGYPVNISYSGGINVDQEASWVGLGWSLNPGAINRSMRGIPDEFDGEEITKETKMKRNWTVGLAGSGSFELFGFEGIGSAKLGLLYNSYTGTGLDLGFGIKSPAVGKISNALGASLNLSYSGSSGLGISPSVNLSLQSNKENNKENSQGLSLNTSASYNSRSGMKALNFGWSAYRSTRPKESYDNMSFGSSGSLIEYGSQSYTPAIQTPMKNLALNISVKFSSEFTGIAAGLSFPFYYTEQKVAEPVITKKAYGYMNLENASEEDMMDLNRENDQPFSENQTDLPVPVHTPDIFSVSAQGIGGSFRVYRNDHVNFHEEKQENISNNIGSGFDIGPGNLFKGGLNLSWMHSSVESGNWSSNNHLQDVMRTVARSELKDDYPEYEPYYFRQMGEPTPSNINWNRGANGYNLIVPNINLNTIYSEYKTFGSKNNPLANKSFRSTLIPTSGGGTAAVTALDNVQKTRQPRNMVMYGVKVYQRRLASEPNLVYFYPNFITLNPSNTALQGRNVQYRKNNKYRRDNHFTELRVLNSDGQRYYFALPQYNLEQTEITFALGNGSSSAGNCGTGLASYSSTDITTGNTKGNDNYLQKITTPAHAYAYKLTGIVSPDYVDLTKNGLTDDDFGTYTKFNYQTLQNLYKWRVPVQSGMANYIEGQRTDYSDDKGSIVYGEKELSYLHSIEGKNHVAVFYISIRQDAYGVSGINGGIDQNQQQYKLDSIVLYNKQDLIANGKYGAYKIKAAHFEYEYNLCGNVPNWHPSDTGTIKGKLTLKKIYFTYGESFKGKLSPYQFNYNNEGPGSGVGYDYHLKAADRWGTYKPAGGSSCGSTTTLNSVEYPFTDQYDSNLDDYAGAWSLSEIILPSGGKIQVEYESDDYAYVQDRRAMSMYKIAGFASEPDYASRSNLLYALKDKRINDYIIIDLPQTTTQAELDEMVSGISDLQVTAFADINGQGNHEFVKCYVEFDPTNSSNYGLLQSGDAAYLKVERVSIRDNGKGQSVNPISKALWNWAKINTPGYVYNTKVSDTEKGKAIKALYEIVGLANEIINLALGINNNLRLRGFGQTVLAAKSWVRLNAHGFIKYGGGHRVKSIRINDNWSTIGSANTSAEDSEYGQEYDYTTQIELPNGTFKTISSGVAAYEPGIGSDENPFHTPTYVREDLRGVPDLAYMNDIPRGESFMPPASVGYSKVTVRSLQHTGVSRTATGSQEYQFYTAKDFPSRVTTPGVATKIKKPSFAQQLFNLTRKSETIVSAGQGYLVELNDMHGKAKAEYTYSENSDEPIGGVEYEYLTNANSPNELSNTVQVVNQDGSIESQEIATEVEVYNDFRKSHTDVVNAGLDLNVDMFTAFIIPIIIPSAFGQFSRTYEDVQTAVTVKLVNRYGLVSKTTAIKEGSKIETENLLYDGETGQVLVTSVQNEFNDNTYSKTTPAHWAYDEGMGQAYKNIGLVLEDVTLHEDEIILPNGLDEEDYLVPGDLVYLYYQTGSPLPLQGHVYRGAGDNLNIINSYTGQPVYDNNASKKFTLQVVRSGRRNMASTPIMQESARYYSTASNNLTLDSMISVSAVEFNNYWPFYNDKLMTLECDTEYTIDPLEVEDYMNELIALSDKTTFSSIAHDFESSCVLETFYNVLGYDGNDTVYTKDASGNYQVAEDQVSSANIGDSLFIDIGNDTYIGYPFDKLLHCLPAGITVSYGNSQIDLINELPVHPLYDQFDTMLMDNPDFDTTCSEASDSVKGYFTNNMFPDNPSEDYDFKVQFFKCENTTCDLDFYLLEDVCVDSVISLINVDIESEYQYSGQLIYVDPVGDVDTVDLAIQNECGLKMVSIDCQNVCTTPDTTKRINPYYLGILGNWRTQKNWAYVGERDYSSQTKTRTDGTFKTYTPYYTDDGNGGMNQSSSSNWVWASEITKYNPWGNEIENKDALGRYSAAIFGYNYTLPTAVAGNSKFKQIAYESFEENSLFWTDANCFDDHFAVDGYTGTEGELSTDYSHSGNYSLKVLSNQSVNAWVDLTEEDTDDLLDTFEVKWRYTNGIGKFNPDTGTYILSAWVKQGESYTDTTYGDASISVKLHTSGSSTTTTYYADGPIIDGWQRVFVSFNIDSTITDVEFIFNAPSSEAAWFDDFRVHPFNSNMKSYAYDQVTLRLMAELDDNNFATYYEYDKEGALIRVKKETVEGVKTLKEIRKNVYKQ